jgi:hypothetical protein
MLMADGLLIATFLGRWTSDWFAGEPWVEDRIGMNVLHHNRGWDDGGPAVLMSEWWVREHWGRAFEIVQIAPQFQNFSWAVMRKREAQLTTEDIERPSDDPREYAAVRHNVRQLQRELDSQAAAHARSFRQCEERILEYENSRSWKGTRPLREVAQALRRRYASR